MKSKSGGGLFGIFKKKSTPAPTAPISSEVPETSSPNRDSNSQTSEAVNASTSAEVTMPPRKGSIARTSVIHYSPPGTVRASPPPSASATSSVTSSGSGDWEDGNAVVITRKSNIVLDDEESVVSTPVSQYDESPIVHKPRKKRAAPPPPASTMNAQTPTSPSLQHPQHLENLQSLQMQNHHRQNSEVSRTSSESTPPPLPPHANNRNTNHNNNNRNEKTAKAATANGMDYEEMLKKLQTKFDEWHQVRLEDGGSLREERIKAEVLKEHEKLKVLLEKEMTGPKKSSSSSTNNNNNHSNIKKHLPLKIPQYGNFYKPPSPSPVRAVPGGTVYQKSKAAAPIGQREKPSPTSSATTSSSFSPKSSMDENRNEIPKTQTPNTAAVDRLRREVEEQREREKEVKQYRNPKKLDTEKKEQEKKEKKERKQEPLVITSPLTSPLPDRKMAPGPRMVEYKPMKSPGLPPDTEDSDDVAPPIPKTPPPKLSEYRKEQPRMPTVPQNGYVRLQVGKKTVAPNTPNTAPSAPRAVAVAQTVYTGPEYASSPKLLRKTAESPKPVQKTYAPVPVKEKEIVYQKPQLHPQAGGVTSSSPYQRGMISATTAPKTVSGSPMMMRAASTEDSGYRRGAIIDASSTYQKTGRKTSTEDYRPRSTVFPPTVTPSATPSSNYQQLPPRKITPSAPSITSATSSPYQRGAIPPPPPPGSTVITIRPTVLQSVEKPRAQAPADPTPKKVLPKAVTPDGTFDISEVLKGPRLRKVGMPVEKSGISLGKVIDSPDQPSSSTPSRPSSVPPPPPPPPMFQTSSVPVGPAPKMDLRDSLMSEIREAGRLRAARASQTA